MILRLRRAIHASLAGLACLSGYTHAASLGEVLNQSRIGEPVRVEIALSGADTHGIEDCVRLLALRDDDPAIQSLRQGTVRLGSGDDNAARLVLYSPVAGEPIIHFTLQNRCTGLRREYTLLLSPPLASPQTPVKAATPRSGASRYTHVSSAPGESLQSIAETRIPYDSTRQQRYIAAIRTANPEALDPDDDAAHTLPVGTSLRLPNPEQNWWLKQARKTPDTASPKDAKAPGQGGDKQVPARQPTPSRGAPHPAAAHDQLQLERVDAPKPDPGTSSGAPTSTAQHEQELLDSLGNVVTAQRQMAERVAQLEAIQGKLLEELQHLEKQRAALATPLPTPVPASPASGIMPVLLGIAIGLSGVLTGLALWWRRRETSGPQQFPEQPEATPVPAPAPQPEDDEALFPDALETPSPAILLPTAPEVPDTPVRPVAPPPAPPSASPLEFTSPLLEAEDHLQAEEHDSAIELAEIMMSFGRVQGAAETLSDFIRANPKRAITPWLKLLEVYRSAGMRSEFDALSRQLNKTFNVMVVSWERFDEERATSEQSVEQMPHILSNLTRLWPSRECQIYLNTLIRDNRDGTRQGFPLGLIDDLLMLAGVLDLILGPYRADIVPDRAEA